MALQQKRQMVNNVLFKLDEPLKGRAPTDPAVVQGRLNIRVMPDASDACDASDSLDAANEPAAQPDPALGYSLDELAERLKKK